MSWIVKKLGDLLKIQNGYAFDSKLFSIDGDMPLIRIRDIKKGVDTETRYTGEYDSKYIVKKGDLLIGMDGEFGCYEWKGGNALLNQRVCRLQNFENQIYPRFLLYGINSHLKAIEDVTGYTTVKHLSSKQIANIEFPLPPIVTQQKIVEKIDAIFTQIDKATAAAEANAKNTEALFHSYLRKIFNVNFENTKKIDEVCDFINGLWTGKKPPFLNVSVIRNTNFRKNGELDYSDIAQLDVEARQFTSRQLRFGDIVLEKSGGGPKQPVGRVCVFEREDGNFSLSNFTSAIRVKNTQELHFKYLHFYLQHMYIEGETEKIQTNSTGIRNLQLSLYKEFNIPLPSLTEQKLIVNNLKNLSLEADISHNSYKAKVSELNKLKKSILRQAFTGELVKE